MKTLHWAWVDEPRKPFKRRTKYIFAYLFVVASFGVGFYYGVSKVVHSQTDFVDAKPVIGLPSGCYLRPQNVDCDPNNVPDSCRVGIWVKRTNAYYNFFHTAQNQVTYIENPEYFFPKLKQEKLDETHFE